MVRFLLTLSSWLRDGAIRLLNTARFQTLRESDREAIAQKLNLIQGETREILNIMKPYSSGASKEAVGFFVSFGSGSTQDQPRIIIFDMVDGSHCYEIDPPGVCCCDPC